MDEAKIFVEQLKLITEIRMTYPAELTELIENSDVDDKMERLEMVFDL